MTPESKEKQDAEKMRNEMARVNMIDVLLFLLRCPSKFLLMTAFSLLSRLQQVATRIARKPFSTNSKTSTDRNVRPMMIITKRLSKINKNHFVFWYQKVSGTQ
jgi:hypothetical protein